MDLLGAFSLCDVVAGRVLLIKAEVLEKSFCQTKGNASRGNPRKHKSNASKALLWLFD